MGRKFGGEDGWAFKPLPAGPSATPSEACGDVVAWKVPEPAGRVRVTAAQGSKPKGKMRVEMILSGVLAFVVRAPPPASHMNSHDGFQHQKFLSKCRCIPGERILPSSPPLSASLDDEEKTKKTFIPSPSPSHLPSDPPPQSRKPGPPSLPSLPHLSPISPPYPSPHSLTKPHPSSPPTTPPSSPPPDWCWWCGWASGSGDRAPSCRRQGGGGGARRRGGRPWR